MNQEPIMKLQLNGEERDATPDNTFLFEYAGQVAMYDHVFHVDEENTDQAMYIFERLHPEVYSQMREYMVASGYTLHLNMRQVAQCDIDAFNQNIEHFASEEVVPDTLPEDW